MSTAAGKPSSPNSNNRLHQVVLLSVLVLVGGALVLIWNMWTHVTDLQEHLKQSQQHNESLEGELRGLRREADQVRAQADQAQTRAQNAEEQAQKLGEARRQAELEREMARETAERFQAESQQARQEAERARLEAEQIRKQREEELDRMQQALNHIVETRRTPLGMVMNLGEDSFLFDFDKDTLRSENREILSRIAGVLLASHGYRLHVYGHTDDIGPSAYNRNLSERRARAVRDYLVQAGVPADRVEAKGFGESSPAAQGKTPGARQKNRRVEIGLIDTVIHYQGQAKD